MDSPKHGKLDPNNAPHVGQSTKYKSVWFFLAYCFAKDISSIVTSFSFCPGGNTWAGGTGGRDTAGLGGKGGPYRLDAGHAVHQLSQAEKDNVPEHVKKAAR